MKPIRLPSVRYLEQCLLYDAATSKLYWKRRPRSHFIRQSDWRRWNNIFAGKECFCTLSETGYLYGVIGKQIYMTHRIIWKLVTRKEPPPILDHKDRNKTNNAWENLRAATASQNCTNRSSHFVGRSGYRGVYESSGRWMARFGSTTANNYLGTFDTREEARAAWLLEAKRRYGEFAS